ncbi:hypothetical protein J6590_040185 [Homalodisca vitripennis]|nr:hypothetical protein J6590_040185 [Homalodisca vitripennis]
MMVLEGGVLPPPLRLYAAAAAAASNGGCFAPSPVLPPHSLFPHFASRFPLQGFPGIPPGFLHHQHQGPLRFAANLLGRGHPQDIRNDALRRRQQLAIRSANSPDSCQGDSLSKKVPPRPCRIPHRHGTARRGVAG